jgi:hypothetical protein
MITGAALPGQPDKIACRSVTVTDGEPVVADRVMPTSSWLFCSVLIVAAVTRAAAVCGSGVEVQAVSDVE